MKTNEILLIEDDPEIQELTQAVLEEHGYSIVTTSDGLSGVNKALRNDHDLILCDINLPGLDGFEVLSLLRANQKTRDVPIVMLTARYESEDIIRSLRNGASDYVVKPYQVDTLIEIIRNRIKKFSRLKEQTHAALDRNVTKDILENIGAARHLQKELFPSKSNFNTAFRSSFIFDKPRDIVSGDFLWLNTRDDKVYVALFDCTGHGVKAAMLTTVCVQILNSALKQGIDSPSIMLHWANTKMHEFFSNADECLGMDISLCIYNKTSHVLSYAGAKRPLFVYRKNTDHIAMVQECKQTTLYSTNSVFCEIKAQYRGVGARWIQTPSEQLDVSLEVSPSDIFYMSSDGYADQFGGANGKKFLSKNFRAMLESIGDLSFSDQRKEIQDMLHLWQGDLPQTDDVLVCGFSF